MNKHWFRKLLLTYLPVFLFSVALLFLLFVTAYTNLSRQEAAKASAVLSEHLLQLVDSSLKSVDQALTKEILTNDKLIDFFSRTVDNKPFLAFEASKQLNHFAVTNPLVASLYLVHLQDQVVMSEKALLEIARYGDREFIAALDQEIPSYWTNRREFNDFSIYPGVPVVSLVRYVPPMSRDQGIIVVNVSLDGIRKQIEQVYSYEAVTFGIFDRSGQPLMQIGSPEYGQDSADSKMIAESISNYTGWTVRIGMKHGKLFDTLSRLSYIWLISGLGIVIAGIVWIVYATRNNYKPLEAIVRMIRSSNLQEPPGPSAERDHDEFKIIESSLHNLIQRASRYEEWHRQDLIYKKSYLFKELMQGKFVGPAAEWNVWLEQIGMKQRFDRLSVAVVEVDKYAEFSRTYSPRDQSLFKYIVHAVVDEVAGKSSVAVWSEWLENHQLGVLLQVGEDSRADISAILAEVKQWIGQNVSFTVTVGIGSDVEQFADLSQSYEEAKEAVGYKMALGRNHMIEYGKMKEKSKPELYKYTAMIRDIAIMYRLGEAEWEGRIGLLFEGFAADRLGRDELIAHLNDLLFHLYREMMELPNEFQDLWKGSALNQLHLELLQAETAADLQTRFKIILRETFDAMRSLRESKSNPLLLRDVREYVEKSYANPELSLHHLSEAFGIPFKILSRLFKHEFGEKFIDYLTRVRVERAKIMLAETDEPVQDICAKVGYTHPNTLIRVFKKVVGMTPGEYRKERSFS